MPAPFPLVASVFTPIAVRKDGAVPEAALGLGKVEAGLERVRAGDIGHREIRRVLGLWLGVYAGVPLSRDSC